MPYQESAKGNRDVRRLVLAHLGDRPVLHLHRGEGGWSVAQEVGIPGAEERVADIPSDCIVNTAQHMDSHTEARNEIVADGLEPLWEWCRENGHNPYSAQF